MANIRAMAIFQAFTDLPTDRYVNTFHFSNSQDFEDHIVLVEAALNQFYNEANTNAETVSGHLSPVVEDIYTYKIYNLADPEPREPVELVSDTATRESAVGLPEEVAVCLSYHGIPPVTRRRRGRIYVGPLNNAAMTAADSDSFCGIASQFSVTLAQAATRLAGFDVLGTSVGWSVMSTAEAVPVFTPIVAGFIENTLDTQRRRGPEPNGRSTWSL